MKRYLHTGDIPILEITIDIYSLGIISASSEVGGVDKLPQITDVHGNITNYEDFKAYEKFIKSVEDYIHTLPIQKIKFSNSNISVSKYYQFYLLDADNQPIIEVKCTIRISDHVSKSKKLRKGNSAKVQVDQITRNGIATYVYQFLTTEFVAYADILKRIQREMKNFQQDIIEEYGKYSGD